MLKVWLQGQGILTNEKLCSLDEQAHSCASLGSRDIEEPTFLTFWQARRPTPQTRTSTIYLSSSSLAGLIIGKLFVVSKYVFVQSHDNNCDTASMLASPLYCESRSSKLYPTTNAANRKSSLVDENFFASSTAGNLNSWLVCRFGYS